MEANKVSPSFGRCRINSRVLRKSPLQLFGSDPQSVRDQPNARSRPAATTVVMPTQPASVPKLATVKNSSGKVGMHHSPAPEVK
jgi:hypothetical protein